MKSFKFDETIEINGHKLDKKYIHSLNKSEREALIEPIFQQLRFQGFPYPDNTKKISSEWQRLLDFQPDTSSDSLYGNSSVATYICKFFCHNFYKAKDKIKKPNMVTLFDDDNVLKKLIWNRLGLGWIDYGPEETFNLTPKMFVQGFRSMRLAGMTSIFKPDIAKTLTLKYSQPNDIVYDPSAGWGSRMLGVASANRKYIGVDPLTIAELSNMRKFLQLKSCALINAVSENYRAKQNSVDFILTSPPYFNQEIYSEDQSQAYMQGEDYFYNTYWKKTLENIQYMLKPDKYCALNITNYPKMVEMAEKYFKLDCIVKIKLTKSHLNKAGKDDATKFEPIYIFKNNKQ